MSLFRKLMMIGKIKPKTYIKFEDKSAESFCLEKFSSDGIGVTEKDLSKVLSIDFLFPDTIEFFSEFKYFSRCKTINNFNGFGEASKLKKISFPKSLIKLGTACMDKLKGPLELVDFENVQEIGGQAFNNSKISNEVLAFPNLIYLGDLTFRNTTIKKITNLGTIENIPNGNYEGAFSWSFLESIRLPETLARIGNYAFSNSKLNTIILDAVTPPTIGTNAFMNCTIKEIYVPDSSADIYKAAPGWSAYSTKIKPLSEYVVI